MKKWLKRLIIIITVLVLAFILGLSALIIHTPKDGAYALDRTLYQQVSAQTDYVMLEDISPIFLDILIANEDKRFYQHRGFDIIRIGGAFIGNIKAGELETGGSTITQQLAKNLFYTREQTLNRKLLELGTAIRLEHYFSKAQILEMYINVIYYGSDAYGIAQASQIYYNKTPAQLTTDEAAMLVGLLPAPSVYNPNNNLDLAKRHQAEALQKYREIFGLNKWGEYGEKTI